MINLYSKENGSLYGWGYNDVGQLGLGHNSQKRKWYELIPSAISLEDKIISFGCGRSHTIALSSIFIKLK